MDTMAATGAYFQIIAQVLVLRAALRHFSDPDHGDADKCDIPTTKGSDVKTHERLW
jgi:hypothetical protein